MTIFWILAAGLAVLAALFVIAPLLSSRDRSDGDTADADIDQAKVNVDLFKQQLAELDADLETGKLDRAQYDDAKRDLEREVLRDTADMTPGSSGSGDAGGSKKGVWLPGPGLTAVALLFAVPMSAVVIYLAIGERQIIPRLEASAAGTIAAGQGGAPDGMPSLDEMVARLEQRLEEVPDDGQGWSMLGRTYFAMGRRDQAEQALARAHELLPEDNDVTLAYAETIASNNDNTLTGRPAELISEVLAADPQNATALWLSGMAAFQRGQYRGAITAWKNVLSLIDPTSEDAMELSKLIAQAEERAGVPAELQLASTQGAPAPATPPADTPPPAAEPPSTPTAAPSAQAAPPDQPEATSPATTPARPPVAQSVPAADTEPTTAAPDPSAVETPPQPAAASPGIDVEVSLDPLLAGRFPPDTTVFVYARAAAGPPMPLAVQRLTLADLPARVRLDDGMAMMPQMRLSNFPQVIVGARVSPSGQAIPRPGDLEGQTGPTAASGAVSVNINGVRP